MSTLLITGVAGFLGRAFAREFAAAGWDILGTDIAAPENVPLDLLRSYHPLALPSSQLIEILATHRPDLVIHSAGRASVPLSFESPDADFSSGPVVTANVLESIRRSGITTKLIFCSSAAVYGDPQSLPVNEDFLIAPISPYGYHKRIAELLCEQYSTCFGLPTAVMRIFSAYGPGLRRQVVYDTCRQAIQGHISLYGSGAESRDFIHCADVAKAARCIAENARMQGDVYNVANGEETTVAALASLVRSQSVPTTTLAFRHQKSHGMPQRWLADIQKLRSLGFAPSVSFEKGVAGVLKWCAADAGQA
jgi:UDP-glucose 4-epimerase